MYVIQNSHVCKVQVRGIIYRKKKTNEKLRKFCVILLTNYINYSITIYYNYSVYSFEQITDVIGHNRDTDDVYERILDISREKLK